MGTVLTLVAKGRIALDDHLTETADFYRLRINNLGNGRYAVQPDGYNLGLVCPPFIRPVDDIFDRTSLKSLLEFLHQPIRVSIERNRTYENGESKLEANLQNFERRTALHRLLRFATGGTVEIPADTLEELEKSTAECHAKTEQAMRDADGWRSHREIANTKEAQSILPHSRFEPKKGFVFSIERRCLGLENFEGSSQAALNEHFWQAVNQATEGRYLIRQPEIVLNAAELEKFCILAGDQQLGPMLDQVEFEEAVAEKLDSINTRALSLSSSQVVSRLIKNSPADQTEKLKKIMAKTTALAPMISSEEMSSLWARYHYTKRNESPLAGITKDYGVFLAVMDVCAKRGNISPIEMEAVAQEFYPLLAFSERALKVLQESAHEIKAYDAENIFSEGRNTMSNASLSGVHLSQDRMQEDYQDILSILEKSLNRGGSAIGQLGSASVETTVEFTMDIVNFIRESPRVAAIFAGLATTLYVMNGGDQQTAQTVNDTILLLDETGMVEEVAIDLNTLPEEARDVQNWHWDMGPFGLYKHYMYDNAVVGPAQTIMDWVRIGIQSGYKLVGLPVDAHTAFSAAAEKTVKPVADQLFKLNLFQNFSHAAFWMYMVSKGYSHGFRGAKRIFDLFSPMTDLAVQGGYNAVELLHLKKKTSVSERIHSLTEGGLNKGNFRTYEGQATLKPLGNSAFAIAFPLSCKGFGHVEARKCLLLAMAEVAQERVQTESSRRTTHLSQTTTIKIPHLKRTFEIHASNIAPLLHALDRFDLAMSNIADRIGVEEPWMQNYLLEQVGNLRQALKDYQDTGDADELNNGAAQALENLMGTELRIFGESSILSELNERQEDEAKLQAALLSHVKVEYGKRKRTHTVQTHRDKIRNTHKDGPLTFTGHIKSRAAIAGTHLWSGMVAAARKLGDSGKALKHKASIIALSGLTASAVALDMAGGGNMFTDAVSEGAGTLLSAASTTLTFLVYNFWEDVLGVHVGGGAALLAGGAAAGYLYKRGLKPAGLAGAEVLDRKLGNDVKEKWHRLTEKMSSFSSSLGDKISASNRRIGEALTPQASSSSVEPLSKDNALPFQRTSDNPQHGDFSACRNCPYHVEKADFEL